MAISPYLMIFIITLKANNKFLTHLCPMSAIYIRPMAQEDDIYIRSQVARSFERKTFHRLMESIFFLGGRILRLDFLIDTFSELPNIT